MKSRLLSVIMSVYNGESYLEETMNSIVNQTYTNWELIIIDDCSTDATPAILQNYKDDRIILLRNETNLRLAASLNKGLEIASGDYILRMDADDICRADRFECQLSYMEAHPELDFSWGKGFWYRNGHILPKLQTISLEADDIKAIFLFTTPVMHNCCIARKRFYQTYSYNAKYTKSEDWNLWYRASRDFCMAGQNEYLILYRIHSAQTTDSSQNSGLEDQYRTNFEEYLAHIGMSASQQDILFHTSLITKDTPVESKRLLQWFLHLKSENKKHRIYRKGSLNYAFFWEVHSLFRERRITKTSLLTLHARFFPIQGILFFLQKLFFARKDILAQKKARKHFPCF